MRFELVFAAVTRNLVPAIVREVVATRSQINAWVNLLCHRLLSHGGHRWLLRMQLVSMPGDTSSYRINSITPDNFAAFIDAFGSESELLSAVEFMKRGDTKHQPCLVLASCPARSARG